MITDRIGLHSVLVPLYIAVQLHESDNTGIRVVGVSHCSTIIPKSQRKLLGNFAPIKLNYYCICVCIVGSIFFLSCARAVFK